MLYGVPFKVGKDYLEYLERDHPGVWIGNSLGNFGLTPGEAVTPDQFRALRENRHPVTGKRLTARTNTTREEWQLKKGKWVKQTVSNRIAFYDFTVSAPKTFSILALPGGLDQAREWHARAVDKMLVEMESLSARWDKSGKENVLETTGSFAAVRFRHTLNRSGEPGIHDHVLICNATRGLNGKNYALESNAWMRRSKYLTAVYRDALAAEAEKAGFKVSIDDKGAPQISGIEDLIPKFSQRSLDVAALVSAAEEVTGSRLDPNEVKSLVIRSRGLDLPRFIETWSRRAPEVKRAALDLSEGKTARTVILAAFSNLVRECSDGGTIEATTYAVLQAQREILSPEDLHRLRTIPRVPPPIRPSLEKSVQFAIDHLFERLSVVKDHQIYTEALRHSAGGNVDLAQLKRLVAEHPRLVKRGDEFTTREHLTRETDINVWIGAGHGQGVRIPRMLDPKLTTDQLRAMNELLASNDQFTALIGRAGTGKSFCVDGLVRANLACGYRVQVMAPSTKSRDVLEHVNRSTLQMFLTNPKMRASLRPMDLVILDEAGFASVQQVHELMEIALKHQLRVCLSGDPRQHSSVEAGDAFRILLKTTAIKREWLDKIIRQRPEAMNGQYLKAAKLLAQGHNTKAFQVFDKSEALHVAHGADRIRKIAMQVVQEQKAGRTVLSVNATHAENDAINQEVRELLKGEGKLGNSRMIHAHRSLGWTRAEKQQIGRLRPGLIIEVIRGPDKGKAFEVRQVECDRAVGVSETGIRRQFNKANVDMWDACQRRELEISVGDLMITNCGMKNKKGEVINGERFTVAGFAATGCITTTGKIVETKNLNHGWASTSVRSQGETVDTVIFGMSRNALSWMNKKIAYVAGTRGRVRIDIYCENKHEICGIEERTGDRKSAIELIMHRIIKRRQQRHVIQEEVKAA